MGNTNWSAVLNVQNVTVRNTGGKGYVEPDTGAYKVKIVQTDEYEKDGRKSVQFTTEIVDGKFAGNQPRIYIGLDLSKEGNRRSWRAALESIGVPPNELDKADISVGAATFDGAEAFIYFKAKDMDDPKSQSSKEFITASRYEALIGDAAIAANTAPAAASVVKPPVAAPAVPAMTVPQPTGAAARLRGMAARQ